MRINSLIKQCLSAAAIGLCLPLNSHAIGPEAFAHQQPVERTYAQWVSNHEGSLFPIDVQRRGGYDVFEGDVLVYRGHPEGDVMARGLSVTSIGQLWRGGVVPYDFSVSTGALMQNLVLAAVNHWQRNTQLKFVARTPANANQYPDFIRFTNANLGCASYIGRQTGMQEIFLNSSCSVGNIVHEIGHAVGLFHEHTRPDRDSYVQVLQQNIQAERVYNFQALPAEAVRTVGPYDLGSIMHYGSQYFSHNGLPTLVPLHAPLNSIGQRDALSPGDIATIATLYGATNSPVAPKPSAPSFTVASASVASSTQISGGGVSVPYEYLSQAGSAGGDSGGGGGALLPWMGLWLWRKWRKKSDASA